MKKTIRSKWTVPTAPTSWRRHQKDRGRAGAVVNFMTQKMIVEFAEGSDPKAVMKAVLKNCKKVEDDCEIYL